MNSHLLTGMILLPLLGAIFQAAASPGASARWLALGASIASALLGGVVLTLIGAGDVGTGGPHLVDRLPWIGSYAINYELSVDGTNVLMLMLISTVFPVLIASEWDRARGARGLYSLLLILQAALLGAATAQDLFLLFFFWGLTAVPVFFLVGIWGGEKKEQAAFRSLVTSSIGNSLLFAAFILIYYAKDPHSFLIRDLVSSGGVPGKEIVLAGISVSVSHLAFLFVCLGLALRAPVWPFHGWFAEFANEAPASVFVAVAGVVVPSAVMIFARVSHLLFQDVLDSVSSWVVLAGVVNLFVGSVTILSQTRLSGLLSRLVLVHLGLSLIGLGSQDPSALVGVIYHQLAIGLAVTSMGLLFGALAERTGLHEVGAAGGLVERAPGAAAVMALALGGFLGLPGLGGFVGQSLIVMGSFTTHPVSLFGVGAGFMLVTYSLFGVFKQIFLGPDRGFERKSSTEAELTARERGFLVPLLVLLVLIGFYPKPFLDWVRPAAVALIAGKSEVKPAPAAAAVPAPSPSAAPAEGNEPKKKEE